MGVTNAKFVMAGVAVKSGDSTWTTKFGMIDDDTYAVTMMMHKFPDVDADADARGESGSQILMMTSILVLFFIFVVVVVSFIFFRSSIGYRYHPVIIWVDGCGSVVSRSGNGKWPRAVMWRVPVLKSLSRNSGFELLVRGIQRPYQMMRPILVSVVTV